MKISKSEASSVLLNADNILILAHDDPDGDAVGSASALCKALNSLGKTAFIDLDAPAKSDVFMTEGLKAPESFKPSFIIAVDTADAKILYKRDKYPKIDLSIDHHASNVLYADKTCLDEKAAAASEVVYDILKIMGVEITKDIAERLYIGLSTDTGCFRYGNTTSKALRDAADLCDLGAEIAKINKIQFETKSKEYALIERMAISSMEMFFDGKCAMITITYDMFKESGAALSETKLLSSLPRQIEGVLVGVTLKERDRGVFSVSIRTNEPVNASFIAKSLGGGGHRMAAGCTVKGSKEEAQKIILNAVKNEIF